MVEAEVKAAPPSGGADLVLVSALPACAGCAGTGSVATLVIGSGGKFVIGGSAVATSWLTCIRHESVSFAIVAWVQGG